MRYYFIASAACVLPFPAVFPPLFSPSSAGDEEAEESGPSVRVAKWKDLRGGMERVRRAAHAGSWYSNNRE